MVLFFGLKCDKKLILYKKPVNGKQIISIKYTGGKL